MPTFATILFPFVFLPLLFASSSFSMINTDVSSRMVFTGALLLLFAFIVLQITMVSRSPKMILPRRWRQSFLTGFLVYRPTGLHLVSPLVRQCFLQSTNVVRCFFSWWWRCLCNFTVMTVLISSMIWIKMFLTESKSVSVYICLCYFFSGVLNPCCPFQSSPFF